MGNSLSVLKSELVSDRIIKRLDEYHITLGMIRAMVDTDDYSQLIQIPYITKRIAENIALRSLELDSEPIKTDDVGLVEPKKEVNKKEPAEEIKVSVTELYKQDINPRLLPKILEKYIISMIEDPKIPKFAINREHMYPIDSILFGKEDVYIKVSFIKDKFNDYIYKSFNIKSKDPIDDPFKYACVGASIIRYTTVNGYKYQFHKCDVSGNEENYIHVFRKMLVNNFGRQIYINQAMDSYNSNSYMPEIDIQALIKEDKEESVTVYSTKKKDENKKGITVINNVKEDEDKHLHVILNSCHPVFGGKYMATFSVLTKEGSRHNFDTKVNTGIFNFDKDNLKEGEILISNYSGSIPELKRKVISLL